MRLDGMMNLPFDDRNLPCDGWMRDDIGRPGGRNLPLDVWIRVLDLSLTLLVKFP